MKQARPLGEIIRSKDAVIFLGAGASWDSGLPLGDDAAAGIIRSSFEAAGLAPILTEIDRATTTNAPIRWPRLEVALDVFGKYLPAAPSRILETFLSVGISSTHQVLAELSHDSWIWLTTNFDDQIERALASAGKNCRPVVSRAAMTRITRRNKNQLVKLHGDTSAELKDLGATIDQILRTFPDSAKQALVEAVARRPIVFIGYAARDPDLRPLVKEIVRRASCVAWVDKGSPPRLVSEVLALQGNVQYFSCGAPEIFQREMGIRAPKPIHTGSWEKMVRRWAATQAQLDGGHLRLNHALASLCIARDVPACRDAAKRILDGIPNTDEQARRWRLETEFKRLEQLPTNAEPELRNLVQSWKDFVRKERSNIGEIAACESCTLLANYSRKHGDYEGARATAEMAVQFLPQQSEPRVRINALRALGMAQIYCGADRLEEGRRNLSKARAIARTTGEVQLEAQAIEELAFGYIRGNKGRKAAKLLSTADTVYTEIGDPRLLVSCGRNLAETKRMLGDVAGALQLNQEILEYASLLNDYEAKRKTANNLAICLMQTGKPVEADGVWLETVTEANQKGRIEYSVDPLHNRGWLRLILADWAEGERLLRPVVAMQFKRGSKERAGWTLSLIGWCLVRLQRIDEATDILNRIERERLVPVGFPRGHFTMLQSVLKGTGNDPQKLLVHVESELLRYPEARFLALSWVLESCATDLNKIQQTHVLRRCLVAISECKQILLASVLSELSSRVTMAVTASVRNALHAMKPGDAHAFREELVRADSAWVASIQRLAHEP